MQLRLGKKLGANNSRGGCAHQLGAHRVGGLEGALVQEVVVAPVRGLIVLLERVVHIQERQVVPCSHTSHNAADDEHRHHNRIKSTIAKATQQSAAALNPLEHWESSGRARTVDVGKAGLGLVRGFGCLTRPQEHVGDRQHGGNGQDLVGAPVTSSSQWGSQLRGVYWGPG